MAKAFRDAGADVATCDLKPSNFEGIPHFQGDAIFIQDLGWDLVVAHPPCTYLRGRPLGAGPERGGGAGQRVAGDGERSRWRQTRGRRRGGGARGSGRVEASGGGAAGAGRGAAVARGDWRARGVAGDTGGLCGVVRARLGAGPGRQRVAVVGHRRRR